MEPKRTPMEDERALPETPSPDPSLAVRLEVQDIRYQFYSSNLSFTRPNALEFSSRPKVPLAPNAYIYSGLCNQRPYVLSNAPANALFIQQEQHLHSWAQRLAQLRQLCPEDDYNNRLQIRSVEKEVISALNKMFTWKVELYSKIGPPGPLFPGQCPVVDTTRFLQIYEEGDPIMARFVWSGLLLVLVLHLLFHTPQAVCNVVLALLHDQVHNLDMLIEEERVTQLLRSIPRSVKGVLSLFDFDPVVTRYLVCSGCYALTPWKASDNPLFCSHKKTPDSPECNAKLVRTQTEHGEPKQRPIKDYFHQGLQGWMGRWICRPHIEATLRRRKAEFKARREREGLRRAGIPPPGISAPLTPNEDPPLVHDILESKAIQGFAWPDGKLWFDCPDNEFRLLFGFTIDGFHPNFNQEAKQTVMATGIYLFCLNLPLEERYKPENMYLVGVIPGPDKPSTSQINHYISLIVDDLSTFWHTGVRFTRTSLSPEGITTYAAAMPVMCDALGARQNCDQIQEPLLAQAEVLKGLLDGSKETNDLLRIGFTAPNDRNGDVKPSIHMGSGGDATMGGDSDDEMATEMPVRKKARNGPIHCDEKNVALSREFRKMFKATFRGHVLDPGLAGQPPSMESFVLDLEKPPGSSWNKASKNLFVNTVIESNVPEIIELAPTRDDLNRQFINNFRSARLKRAWSKLLDGEKKRKKQQARRKGRKLWLWYRRVAAARHFTETRRHLQMLAAYGPEGMSSDESSHENGTGQAIYKVVNKIWRHPNATACLRTLDRIHRDSQFAPIREVGAGAHTHNRVISDKQTTRPPVRGLPTGLYNPGWLTNQLPVFKQDLEVIPSNDYNFSHDASIKDLTQQRNHGQLDSVHIFT